MRELVCQGGNRTISVQDIPSNIIISTIERLSDSKLRKLLLLDRLLVLRTTSKPIQKGESIKNNFHC